MKAILICLLVALFLMSPVSAYIANSSSVVTSYTDVQFKSSSYIPYQYEALLIGFALICWVLMKYIQDLEVIFGFLAILAFGAAAWFAAYMSIDRVFTIVDTTGATTVLYATQVTPQPVLQVILVVCFLFAIIVELYVVFLRQADTVTDKQSLLKRSQG